MTSIWTKYKPFFAEWNQSKSNRHFLFIDRYHFWYRCFGKTCNILPLSLKKSRTICIWLPLSKFFYIFPSLLCFPYKWFIHQVLELGMMKIQRNVPTVFRFLSILKYVKPCLWKLHTNFEWSYHKAFYLNVDVPISIFCKLFSNLELINC